MEAGAAVTRRAMFVRLGGALAGGMMASACGVVRAGNGAGASGAPVAAGSRSPELVWRRPIGGIVSLALSGDTVSLGTEGGGSGAEALDAATGKPRWSGSSSQPPSVAFAAGGGMVLCGGTDANGADNITALSEATGHLLWSAPADVGNPNNGSGPWLTFADNAVYALIGLPGSHAVYRDDVALALDGRTGARKWMSRLPPMAMAMAVADGTVYAGSALGPQSASGEVVALDGATGARRKHQAGGQYPSAPAVVGDDVYVGYQNSVRAFSARTGQQLWSYPAEGLVTKLAASSDVLYASADAPNSGYALYALRV